MGKFSQVAEGRRLASVGSSKSYMGNLATRGHVDSSESREEGKEGIAASPMWTSAMRM